MSLRSQRPQNPPPPSNSDGYSNYRPQIHSPPLRSNSNGASSPAPPSASASASASSSTTGAGGKPPPLTLEQSKAVARTHYDALKRWLTREGALANASTRTNAREKLTRLTRQQFQELSTDVYDELVRRMEDAAGRPGEQPFLAVRPDFHPKRNQARQKLATLPLQRFRDLASDVYFELDRRYPEFGEEDQRTAESHSRSASLSSSAANHSNLASPVPPPNLNAQRRAPTPNSSHSYSHSTSPSVNTPPAAPNSNDVVVPNKSTMVVEEPSGGFHASSSSAPSPNEHRPDSAADDRSLSPNLQSGASSSFNFGSGGKPYLSSSNAENDRKEELVDRQPSPAGGARPGQGQGHQSRASEASSIGTSKFFGGYAGSAGASEAGGRRSWDYEDRSQLEKQKADYEYKLAMLQNRVQELERENEDAATAMKGRQGEQGRDELLRFERRNQRFDDQSAQLRSLQRDHDILLQQQRSFGSPSLSSGSSVADVARLRSDLAAAEDLANELRGEVSSLVDELRMVNERSDELQAELERERAEKEERKREAKEWKERWQAAKTELRNIKATSQLFTSSISVDNDYMPASPDGLINDSSVAAFQTSIDDLLQAARSKEPSSVLPAARAVVSACAKIDSDVQSISPSRLASLPLADQDTVNSLKAKINATLSNLMTASKNHAMSFGVSPVSLLDAAASHLATTIVELVRILKIRRTSSPSAGRFSFDPPSAGIGRKTYAHDPMPSLPEQPPRDSSPNTAPPVSLAKPNGNVSGGMSSVKHAFEAMGISSSASSSKEEGGESGLGEGPRGMVVQSPQSEYGLQQQQDQARTYAGESSWDRQPPQQQQEEQYGGSYENGRYGSPPIQQHGQGSFDQGQQYGGDEYGQSPREDDPYGQAQQQHREDEDRYGAEEQYSSPGLRGSDRDPEELRAYIENQTEAIVHSIQSLLSAIRSGAQGSQLNENLTQIITIVSSIVAISKEALPDHSRSEGDAILQDLTDHCDKLSEMQSQSDGGAGHQGAAFTKQTKQAMASASFGVAKSLKQLNGLLSSGAGEEGLV
ncbi:hypothetical protein JCM1841_002734 [Sporobolomyces salmonicolor]